MKNKRLSIGLFFVCGTLLCGIVGFGFSIRAANQVKGLAPVTATILEDTLPGQEVLVEGRVSSRNPVQSHGFVAYIRQEREIYTDDEGRPDPGNWSVREQVRPPLLLELSDGLVQIENDDYNIENGKIIEGPPVGIGTGIKYSDTRYKGLAAGDPVVAVGVVVEQVERPQIEADFVARGTRESYIASRRSGGVIFCLGSVVVAAVGGVILLWDRVSGWLCRRR